MPMYQEDRLRLTEEKRKRDRYWQMLCRAKNEFWGFRLPVSYPQGFYDYLKNTYGLQVELIGGQISPNYTVADPKKYTIFLLKFGH